MKVLALGGSGGMGRYAVQSLYKHSKIKKFMWLISMLMLQKIFRQTSVIK